MRSPNRILHPMSGPLESSEIRRNMSSVQGDGEDKDLRFNVPPPNNELCPDEHALTRFHASSGRPSAMPVKDEPRRSTKSPTAYRGWTPSTWARSSEDGIRPRCRPQSGSPTLSRRSSQSYSRGCKAGMQRGSIVIPAFPVEVIERWIGQGVERAMRNAKCKSDQRQRDRVRSMPCLSGD